MNFVTIDFATANRWVFSPCSVAVIKYENGNIIDSYHTLIYQPAEIFDDFCVNLHGITHLKVETAPTLKKVLLEIINLIEGELVFAHNARFDIDLLLEGLEESDITIPTFKYACTMTLARRAFTNLPNYRLDTVAKELGASFKQYDTLEDARVCGLIVLNSIKVYNAKSFDELFNEIGYVSGSIDNENFSRAYAKKYHKGSHINYSKIADSIEINTSADPENFFFEKEVVFTGALDFKRADAMKLIGDLGGIPSGSLKKSTNILVVGHDDYGNFKTGNKSLKMLKAEKYITEGQDIELISEEDFYEFVR